MKVLIVLALVLAVSNAAFTGSLIKQAQPVVNEIRAEFAQNIRARSSADVGLQNSFADAIQAQINQVLTQIQTAIVDAQAQAGQLTSSILSAISQIQTAAQGLGSQSALFIQQVQSVLSGLFGQLAGGQSRASFDISEDLIALARFYYDTPTVQDALQSSSLVQCLNTKLQASTGQSWDLDFVLQLNEDNLLNVAHLRGRPEVRECVRAEGGLAAIIQNSAIVARLKALVVQFGLQDVLKAKIIEVLGAADGESLWSMLQINRRSTRESIEISPETLGLINYLLGLEAVQDAMHGSSLYQCLNDKLTEQTGEGLTLGFVLQLNQDNLLTVEHISGRPEVRECVRAEGGLAVMIQNSAIVARIKALVIQFGLQSMVYDNIFAILGDVHGQMLWDLLEMDSNSRVLAQLQGLLASLNLDAIIRPVLIQLLGEAQATQLLALLTQSNRGLFDGLSTMWGSVTAHVASLGQTLSTIAGNLQEKFELIQTIASSFISGGLEAAQTMGAQAAQSLIDAMTPFAEDLGQVYHETVARLAAIYQGLNLPSFV